MSRFGLRASVGLFAVIVALLVVGMSAAQDLKPLRTPVKKMPKKMPVEAMAPSPLRPEFGGLVTLPTNRDLERRIEAVRDYIQSGDWRQVTRALQDILDYPQDAFMPLSRPGPGGKSQNTVWVSVRVEANRLLGGLPAKGREVYEVSSGARAAALLHEAKRTGDPERLAEVAERYLHTRAGAEAADLLGTHHLDRGRYLMAASCLGRMVQRGDTSPFTLFKAALAASRAGDQAAAAAAWKRLSTAAPDGLALGERQVGLDDLKKMLAGPANKAAAHAASEWPMFGGDVGRNSSGSPLQQLGLKRKWDRPTADETAGKQALQVAVRSQLSRNQPVLPGSFPIAAAGKIVVRNQRGLQCVDPASGEVIWEAALNGGMDNPLHLDDSSSIKDQLHGWATMYAQNNPQTLLENSTIGTLSSDGRRVFAVEDVCVPPTFNPYMGDPRFGMRAAMMMNVNAGMVVMQPPGMPFAPANASAPRDINHNHLVCVDAETGTIQWTLGRSKTALDTAYFLGPPLPLAGKLYGLIEKEQELRLICIEPRDGKVAWTQPLANFSKGISQEFGRRAWAAHLAYGEGVLVCPTHSGAVVAVDLLSHSLLWAHSYTAPPPAPAKQQVRVGNQLMFVPGFQPYVPRLIANWRNSSPIVAGGKVLIAAPDANALHCLNLRDGSLVWKVDWTPDDCYVGGVIDGKVLIVGKHVCRAHRLADGKTLWTTPTGLPCGHGVAAGRMYYLPVCNSGSGWVSSLTGTVFRLCALDMSTGKVAQRAVLPHSAGNLLLYQGRLVSQTVNDVSAFAAQ